LGYKYLSSTLSPTTSSLSLTSIVAFEEVALSLVPPHDSCAFLSDLREEI
jgi:hypothetical protein